MVEYLGAYFVLMVVFMLLDMATFQFSVFRGTHFFGGCFVALCIPPFLIFVALYWTAYGVLGFYQWCCEVMR